MAHPAVWTAVPILALLLAPAALAQGEEGSGLRPIDRRFTYVEETLHGAAPGHFEYEQWVTWKTDSETDSSFDRLEFKHEVEYGLSERVHLAIDLAEWHWEDGADGESAAHDSTAAEVKFRLMDPRTDAVGLGYRTEVGMGRKGLEWENRIIVDKVVGRWQFAYNFLVEAGWESDHLLELDKSDGEIKHTLGASLELSPSLYVGAEAMHEIPLPEWESGEDQNFFIGPNFAYHGDGYALTSTALFLVDGGDEEPSFQLRFVFELDF